LGTKFHFYYDDLHNEYGCLISGTRNDGKAKELVWTWSGSSNYDDINIIYSFGSVGIGPFGGGKKPTWKVVKLTNNEFELKTSFNDKEYNTLLK
jgi:hypothetical protein